MSRPTARQRRRAPARRRLKNDSTHLGPSSSMKNVMKVIVTVASTTLTTPFARASAVPETPKSFEAPPLFSASRALSTRWYLSLEEPEATAALRHVVQVVRDLPGEVVDLIDERRG